MSATQTPVLLLARVAVGSADQLKVPGQLVEQPPGVDTT